MLAQRTAKQSLLLKGVSVRPNPGLLRYIEQNESQQGFQQSLPIIPSHNSIRKPIKEAFQSFGVSCMQVQSQNQSQQQRKMNYSRPNFLLIQTEDDRQTKQSKNVSPSVQKYFKLKEKMLQSRIYHQPSMSFTGKCHEEEQRINIKSPTVVLGHSQCKQRVRESRFNQVCQRGVQQEIQIEQIQRRWIQEDFQRFHSRSDHSKVQKVGSRLPKQHLCESDNSLIQQFIQRPFPTRPQKQRVPFKQNIFVYQSPNHEPFVSKFESSKMSIQQTPFKMLQSERIKSSAQSQIYQNSVVAKHINKFQKPISAFSQASPTPKVQSKVKTPVKGKLSQLSQGRATQKISNYKTKLNDLQVKLKASQVQNDILAQRLKSCIIQDQINKVKNFEKRQVSDFQRKQLNYSGIQQGEEQESFNLEEYLHQQRVAQQSQLFESQFQEEQDPMFAEETESVFVRFQDI